MRPFGKIRKELNLTHVQAAARLGISPGHLKQLEAGCRPLSMVLAAVMAQSYGVTVTDLVRPREERRPGRKTQQTTENREDKSPPER